MRLRGSDSGALGVPGLVKLAVALGVLGVLGYDTFVTIATHLKAESDAQNAAYAASQWWQDNSQNRSALGAYQVADEYLAANQPSDHLCAGPADTVCGSKGLFTIDDDGTVHLMVRREAKTLVFSHIGFMHHLVVAYEQGDANSSQD